MKSAVKVTMPSFKEFSDLALVILNKGLDLPPDHKEWLVDISMGNFRRGPGTIVSWNRNFVGYYFAFVRSVAYKIGQDSINWEHNIYTSYSVAYRYFHENL